MKHQLERKTMCHPKDKTQALEILKLSNKAGLIPKRTYTERVLNGEQDWLFFNKEHDIAISFSDGGRIHAMGRSHFKSIPVEEFIARLKGEWEKPELYFTVSLELNGKTYKWGFKK